jgi:uncharacterized membrane protein
MKRTLLAGTLALAAALPVFAAEQYFVALDTSLNQCRVMSTEPDGMKMKMIGSAFHTLAEASAAMQTLPECNS